MKILGLLFLIVFSFGLTFSGCKEDELSGVWYLYKNENLELLENSAEIEITRNISDMYKKAGDNCKYNFSFNL